MTAHTMSGVGSSLVTKQHDVEVARTTLGCSSPAGGPNTSSDKLDGFTLAEWAAFARKKASIASSVAKLNGELKSKLARASSRDGWFCNDPWADSAKTRDGELNAQMASSVDTYPERSGDLLNKFDPWAGATFHGTKAKESPTDGADAWSQWIPGAFSEKSKGKFDVMGKSANNKSVLTDDFKDDCKGLPLSELPHKVTSWNDAMGDVGDDHSVEYHVAPITGDAVPKDSLNDIKGDWRTIGVDGWRWVHGRFLPHPFTMNCHEYVSKRWPTSRGLKDGASHWQRYGGSATLPDGPHYMIINEGFGEEGRILRALFHDAWSSNAKGWPS